MRMSKSLVALLLISVINIYPAVAIDIPIDFSFTGSGYGHGVGMSQMGARSMAISGSSAPQILQYFYKDIVIEPLDDSKILRVNIGHLLTSSKISTGTDGAIVQLFEGEIGDKSEVVPLGVFTSKASLNLTVLGASVIPSISVGKKVTTFTKGRSFTIRWSGTRYLSGTDALISVTHNTTTKKYRYGQMQVRAVKDPILGYRLELTNSVRLSDEYLWGISEMPTFWPIEALKAQVIASRSYAMSKAGTYRSVCDCELYGEISDQMFLGYAKEIEKTYGAIWKEIVSQSAGLVMTQEGRPITAYFSSSSGGKTELALNAWGSTKTFTQIVDDPGSLDRALNPRFATWSRTVAQPIVAAAFLLPDVVALEVISRNESGTVGQIRATSSTGAQFTIRGETFRSRTKIPSAYFNLVGMQN